MLIGRAAHDLTLEHAKPWDAKVLNAEQVMHSTQIASD
jgi:hypothetical protein